MTAVALRPAASSAAPRAPAPFVRYAARGAVVLVAAWVLLSAAASGGQLAVFWLFGLAVGVILQRSRLCFASAFRDVWLLRDGGSLRALLAGLAVASVGFALVEVKSVPAPAFGALPAGAHVLPVSLQFVAGGLFFGLGMVLAGGCVSGTLYRVGEGYVGSLVALLGILGGLVVATQHWNWWWQTFTANAPTIWLPASLGYAGAVTLTLVLLGAAAIASLAWELRAGPRPAFGVKRVVEQPATSIREWAARHYAKIFRRGWPFLTGALVLALLNVGMYLYDHPLGVTGELSNWANRAAASAGIATPALLGASGLSACLLTLDAGAGWVNNGTMLDGGLVLGALLAALLANEFKLRLPRQPVRYVQSLGGGLLMGYGAGLAAGCTIGAFYSAIPSLGLNGWVFGLALLLGSYGGVQVIRRL
jgi:uncharacterized membrane protein YedE/YeeE